MARSQCIYTTTRFKYIVSRVLNFWIFSIYLGGISGPSLRQDFSLFLPTVPRLPSWDHFFVVVVSFSEWGLLDYSGSVNSNPNRSEGTRGYEFHDSLKWKLLEE